jgi:hypothetical protein
MNELWREACMARTFGRILAGALLAGAVLTSAGAGAQSNRAWSDPPADLNAGPLTEDPASRAGPARSADAWPDEAARRRRAAQVAQSGSSGKESPRTVDTRKVPDVRETGSTRTAGARDDAPAARESAAREAIAKAEEAETRAAAASREAVRKEAARQRKVREAREVRETREAQARETRARREAVAQQRRRALAARNTASDRIRTAQPAEYEVMRLRTLVYPDGRVVEVLSRPDQDLVDLPVR